MKFRHRKVGGNKVSRRFKGGIFIGETPGRAVPKNNRRGCLCDDRATYSRECCEGLLINQSIGSTARGALERGAFSSAFSTAFDIKDINDY